MMNLENTRNTGNTIDAHRPTIFFDLDGTLLDTAPDFLHAINPLRNELALPPIELDRLRPAVSHGIAELMQVGFGMSNTHPDYKTILERVLLKYTACLAHHTQPFPGILSLLSALEAKQLSWGVVTNRPAWSAHSLLEALDLEKRACCIISGDTTPNPKPHPDPLLLACQQISVSPQHCIYIGDAERDIVAGRAAGMATIGVLFGYIESVESALQWGADHYVSHADELLPWILSWQPGAKS